MSNTKEKLDLYLPTLKAKMRLEPDQNKKWALRIKIKELMKLRDEL